MTRVFCLLLALAAAAPGVTRAQDDPASRRQAIELMYPVMIQALEAKSFGRARNICEQAILWEPQNPMHHYNLGCIEAQAGRRPQAISALELAAALGFNDAQHAQNDPDLAPLRGDPKFAEIVRKFTNNAIAANAVPGMAIPGGRAPAPVPTAPAIVEPAPAEVRAGRPIGLYFVTRARPAARSAWYFAPDGHVYQNVEFGFSPADLTAARGRQGTAGVEAGKLTIRWADGRRASGQLQRKGTTFTWDGATFTPAAAFTKAGDVPGVYERGEAIASGIDPTIAAARLEVRADGTFNWNGIAFRAVGPAGEIASAAGATTGTWRLEGCSLTLTDRAGTSVRRILFPVAPRRVAFGGILFQKK